MIRPKVHKSTVERLKSVTDFTLMVEFSVDDYLEGETWQLPSHPANLCIKISVPNTHIPEGSEQKIFTQIAHDIGGYLVNAYNVPHIKKEDDDGDSRSIREEDKDEEHPHFR